MVCTTLSTTPPRITQETRLKRGKLVLKIPGPPPGVFRAEGTIWVRRSGPGLHMRHEDLLTSQRSNAQRSIFKGSLVLNPDPLLPCILGSTFNVQRFNSPWGGIFLMYIYNNKGLTRVYSLGLWVNLDSLVTFCDQGCKSGRMQGGVLHCSFER